MQADTPDDGRDRVLRHAAPARIPRPRLGQHHPELRPVVPPELVDQPTLPQQLHQQRRNGESRT